jgi:penicillin-binding protein 1A
MNGGSATSTGTIWSKYMREAYAVKGWGDKDFTRPSGIQELSINGRKDIYPSWFKKPKELTGKQFTVDKVSKKLATDCTPELAREVISATGIDAGEGITEYHSNDYDLKNKDDKHSCDDAKPTASLSATTPPNGPPVSTSNPKTVTFTLGLSPGSFNINQVEIIIDGQSLGSAGAATSGSSTFTHAFSTAGSHTVQVRIQDEGYYQATISQSVVIQ